MTPQYASDQAGSFCSVGPRPLLMTGLLVQWLRQHYSTVTNLQDPDLAKTGTAFVWTPTSTTGLVIESMTRFDPTQIASRPALIVKRGSWRFVRKGINNEMMGTRLPNGDRAFAAYWQGTHTVFCLAGTGAETEKLAGETFAELVEFAPLVRQSFALHRLEVAEVGELNLLEESAEHYGVPVSLGYVWEEKWLIRSSRPALKAIDLTLLQP